MYFASITSIFVMAVLTAAVPFGPELRNGMAVPLTRQNFGFVNADESVNFVALKSHVASVEANIRLGLANFERNTKSVHPAVAKRHRRRWTGTTWTEVNSAPWHGLVSVGDPPQNFTGKYLFFLLSTGFEDSDLILPGPACDSTCGGHTHYVPTSSSTARDLHRKFNITFDGTSSTSGKLYVDTVSLAGFTATDQILGAARTYAPSMSGSMSPPDGVMGMGFQSISQFGATPVFQTLVSDDRVPAVFSFKLSPHDGGELYVGGTNRALYTGDFAFAPVLREGFWQVHIDHVKGNGRTLMADTDAIVDTSTAIIVGLPADVSWFHKSLGGTAVPSTEGGSGYYTFPCDAFPDVNLYFGGRGFAIATSALNLGRLSVGSSECVSGIVASQDPNLPFWVIGGVFLQGVYTTFDVANSRVGFAQLA